MNLKVDSQPHREWGHLWRFGVVGALSVATDLGVFRVLHGPVGWDAPWAKGTSYFAGMLIGFGLNKWWAFGSHRRAAGEAAGYVALYAVTLGINVAVYGWASYGLLQWGLVEAAPAGAFVAATGTSTVLNYLGLRYLTFRRGIAEQEAAAKGAA